MKRLMTILGLILFASFFQTSCGDNSSNTTSGNSSSSASRNSSNPIINKTIKIENLEIAYKDFPEMMNWDDAQKACAGLGDGWRLPTRDEQFQMIRNFTQNDQDPNAVYNLVFIVYWSSEVCDASKAWAQHMVQWENRKCINKSSILSVRAVRDMDYDTEFEQQIIGNTIKIGKLEIAQQDFPSRKNWEEAKKSCASLGDGWRLPTEVELNILLINRDAIGGFSVKYYDAQYWSSTEFNDREALSIDLYNYSMPDSPIPPQDVISPNEKHHRENVRAVRTI